MAGAVQDFGLHAALAEEAVTGRPNHVLHVRDALGWDPDNFIYVNSGVLLLDLAALRRERFGDSWDEMIERRAAEDEKMAALGVAVVMPTTISLMPEGGGSDGKTSADRRNGSRPFRLQRSARAINSKKEPV